MITKHAARGHVAMLLFSILVAGSFSLGNIIAPMITPAAVSALRFCIAVVILGTLIGMGPGFHKHHYSAPWRYLALGFLFALYFVLMFEALKIASPVSTSAVFTLTPFMSAGFGWLLLRQITTPKMALALSLAAIGAIWVIFNGDINAILAFQIGKGEAIFFFGCLAHGLYTPLVRTLKRGEPTLVFTFGTAVAGAIILCIYGATDIINTDWASLPIIVWITVAYLSIFTTATTFFLVQYSTMHLPSAKVMAYTYLVPSWVILWEYFMGNGLAPLYVFAGIALTVVALIMLLKD